MFNFLKKEKFKIVAPVNGELVSIDEIPDDMFSKKMLGDGFGVHPSGEIIVAPVAGIVESVFPTGHAYGIRTSEGIECIVHIGVDTVELKGEGFIPLIKQGDKVKCGAPLVQIKTEFIKDQGYNPITIVVFPTGYDHSFNVVKCIVESGEQVV